MCAIFFFFFPFLSFPSPWRRRETDLLPGADVQPLHHFGKRALVDHLPHQIGSHPLGVGEATQHLPGDLQGGQGRTLPARPRGFPLGHAALSFASLLCHHVVRSRFHCYSWHAGRGPGPMRPPLTLAQSTKEDRFSWNTHTNAHNAGQRFPPKRQVPFLGCRPSSSCKLFQIDSWERNSLCSFPSSFTFQTQTGASKSSVS